MVLNRCGNLGFKGGSALIPEELGFNGKSCIDQAHGMAGGQTSLYSLAGKGWIAESKGLLVTASTSDRIVDAETFIVKKVSA